MKTMKKPQLTIKALRTEQPWEIAKRLGLGYAGDCNPIPHRGYFYNPKTWDRGYSEIVELWESQGTFFVSRGEVSRPSNVTDRIILGYSGWTIDDETGEVICSHSGDIVAPSVTPEILIECVKSYWGYCGDTMGEFESDNGEDWGEFPEFRIMQCARPHILALATE